MGSGMQRAMSWFQYVVSSVWGLYVFITRTALAMLQVGVHQRVPVILGSAEDVEECLGPWSFGVTDSYWHTWRWRFELMPSLQILNNVSHLEMVVFSTSKISFEHLLYHVVLCHMQISRSRTQQGDFFPGARSSSTRATIQLWRHRAPMRIPEALGNALSIWGSFHFRSVPSGYLT